MNNSNRVKILFQFHDEENNETITESLWAIAVKAGFQIDNIPFYVFSVSLGDVFSGTEIEGQIYGDKLLQESGNSTIRILFNDLNDVEDTRKILKDLYLCESEVSNFSKLISVNIPSDISYLAVKFFLEEGEKEGKWEYQESCLSSQHNP